MQNSSSNHPDILPTITPAERKQLLTNILSGVSRSFYLTLRILPASIREQVSLAYLLARAADTLADTTVLPVERRLECLQLFQQQISGEASPQTINEIEATLGNTLTSANEQQLLNSLPQLFSLLAAQTKQDKESIQSVVTTLCSGMVFDLKTFPAEESGNIKALKTAHELDAYTYMVAGCVGEFWTGMSVAHIPALGRWYEAEQIQLGIRFGKALQLTNILRDLPRDLRIGRCYLPQTELDSVGLTASDLLNKHNSARARPLLVNGLRLALDHYTAAENYLLEIPRRCIRLRLAALWPVLIGLGTLNEIATNPEWLNPDITSKVTRGWVYRMLLVSLFAVGSNNLAKLWIAKLSTAVERQL